MPDSERITEDLASLINSSSYKERECREFLRYVQMLLVPERVEEFIYVEKEYRGSLGDSDYVISCKIKDEAGVGSVQAFIWEIKAPQCYIFEQETKERLKPSDSLIQAENQLLNYHHESKGNDRFKNICGVTHPDNVHFGGIIIGRNDRKVSGDIDEVKKDKLFAEALGIRKKYIYDPLNIRIFPWNFILDFLNPSEPPVESPGELGQVQSQTLDPSRITVDTFKEIACEVSCPQCGAKYRTTMLKMGQDNLVFGSCPKCGYP